MLDTIRTYYQNVNYGDSPCSKILGSESAVGSMANVYTNKKKDLAVIATAHLLDFATNQQYTPSELAAYKAGLAVFPEFMRNCELETADKQKT